MRFSRQGYWSGLPRPPPGDLPDPGIEPTTLLSPVRAAVFFTTSAPWEALTFLKNFALTFWCLFFGVQLLYNILLFPPYHQVNQPHVHIYPLPLRLPPCPVSPKGHNLSFHCSAFCPTLFTSMPASLSPFASSKEKSSATSYSWRRKEGPKLAFIYLGKGLLGPRNSPVS